VLFYAVLDESVVFSSRSSLYVDGKELGRMPCLAICEDNNDPNAVLLLHCERDWIARGCAAFKSVTEAQERAERSYSGVSARWVDANVSHVQAEEYLDQRFGEHRCSLCGRRADKIDRLIEQDGGGLLCNFCLP
jgi:hypothetical protein